MLIKTTQHNNMRSLDQEQQAKFCNIAIATIAKDCVRCASDHNGCVFGGYVRDVILPIYLNKSNVVIKIQDLKFKNIDLWFKNDEDVNAFITEMGSMVQSNPRHNITEQSAEHPFTRERFHVIANETALFQINVIISEKLPVNDFEINKACFIVRDGKFKCVNEFAFFGNFRQKEIVMCKDYVKILLSHKNRDNSGYNPYFNRVINKFLLQGYKICLDIKFSSPFCMIADETIDCLKRRFKSDLQYIARDRTVVQPSVGTSIVPSQSLNLDLKIQKLEDKLENLTNAMGKFMELLNVQ